MHLRRVLGNLLVLAAAAAPLDAWADRVVLAPLIPIKGVDNEEVANLFALFSSELEFMAGVDEIIEVEPRPPSLTTRCLESSRCLGEIVRESGGETMIAGTVEALGSDYILNITYYADGRIARAKTYTVPQAPTPLVGAITPVLAEVVTGVSPVQEKKQAEMVGVSFSEGDDDFAFSGSDPAPAREPEPSYGARSRDERIVAPPPPPPPPREPDPLPEEEDDFDPAAFELGVASPEEISFGSVSTTEMSSPEREPEPVRVADPYDDEEEEYYASRRADLDDPEPRREPSRSTPSRSTSSNTRKAAPEGYEFRRVYLTAKGGMSRYGIFTFGSAGAEIGVRATGGLEIVIGAQAYIVRRAVDTQGTIQTNFIFPINAGLLYRIKDGRFQPYAGLDVVFSQLLRDATTGKNYFAFGGRARLGFDYFFVPQVGINLDIGLGVLGGDKWQAVDSRLPTLGFYPTGTVGFSFAF